MVELSVRERAASLGQTMDELVDGRSAASMAESLVVKKDSGKVVLMAEKSDC